MQSLSACIPLESLLNILLKIFAKGMFTLTVFEILLSDDRSVLSPAQWGLGSERVNVCLTILRYYALRVKFVRVNTMVK